MATPSAIYQTAGDNRLFYQNPQGQYTQIANPTELQSLASQGLVQVGGQRQTLPQGALGGTPPLNPSPTNPTPVTVDSSGVNNTLAINPATNPTESIETRPGVYKSSGLTDFYQNQIERMRTQADQAASQLSDVNKQISGLYSQPSLSQQFTQQSQAATSGIDATLAQRTNELNQINQSLASIEQDVRNRIAGQAPESYIQAVIAKEAQPLVRQQQALQENVSLLQNQRQQALQSVQQAIGLSQADREQQLGLLNFQQNLAKQTVDSFNTLLEKGAAASAEEQQQAQKLFTTFLEQSPGFLSKLSEDEIAQMQRGILPVSALQKLGEEAKNTPTKGEIIGSAETGYFRVDPFTGDTQQIIAPRAPGSSITEADVRTLADSLFKNDTTIPTYQDAYAQAQAILRGEPPTRQTNVLSLQDWAMQQNPALGTALKLGLPVSQAVRDEYEAYVTLSTPQRGTRDEKPPTTEQFKAATFAERTAQANEVLADIEGGFTNKLALGGFLPNFLQGPERQQFEQAKRNFVNAVLRRESGAAISPSEFSSAELQYFAQPGDSAAVLEQKRQNRETAINGLRREAGNALSQGFNNVPSTTLNGSLGSLSARFESKGNPGVIGYDSTGGLSYGAYQLAHRNAQTFVNQSRYANEFKGIPFNSQQFQQKWKQVAARDPQGFLQAQHDFIQKTHFEPQVKKLEASGVNVASMPQVVKDVIWSTAVQHGPNNDIIKQAVAKTKSGDPAELVRNIYALRWAGGRNFARSTPEVKQGVYNRFFAPNGEMATALAALQQTSSIA